MDEIAVYGNSLRSLTKKRQLQLQNQIGAIAVAREETENSTESTQQEATNMELRKDDTHDALTVSTINDSSSNFSEIPVV